MPPGYVYSLPILIAPQCRWHFLLRKSRPNTSPVSFTFSSILPHKFLRSFCAERQFPLCHVPLVTHPCSSVNHLSQNQPISANIILYPQMLPNLYQLVEPLLPQFAGYIKPLHCIIKQTSNKAIKAKQYRGLK